MKPKRHYTPLEAEINRIIRCAERNKPSLEWEWANDNDDFLLFLNKEIAKHGSIEQDEM